MPLHHYKPVHSACHLNQQHTVTESTHMQVIQKPCGDGRADEAVGEETLGAVWLNSERNLHFAKGKFLSRKEGLSTKGRYLWGPIS